MVLAAGSVSSHQQAFANKAEQGRLLLSKLESASLSCCDSLGTSTAGSQSRIGNMVETKQEDGTVQIKLEHVDSMYARKPGVIPKMWTQEEDEQLRRAVVKYGERNWRKISEEVPNRNHLQCLQRWKKALRPGLVKGHWSKEEDEMLLELIRVHTGRKGIEWAAIAKKMDGRNSKQCKERWCLNLDPSINRAPWTEEEDALLMEFATKMGGRWSYIAKQFPGRTENSVKTRFHSLERKLAKERGWQQWEDDALKDGVMEYGRDFPHISRLLPGRSRGALKKRFAALVKRDSSLTRKAEEVEEMLRNGLKKKLPIHEMQRRVRIRVLDQGINVPGLSHLDAVAPLESKSTGAQLQGRDSTTSFETLVDTQHVSPPLPPFQKRDGERRQKKMTNFDSSFMDSIVENITPPLGGPALVRSDSTSIIADIISPSDFDEQVKKNTVANTSINPKGLPTTPPGNHADFGSKHPHLYPSSTLHPREKVLTQKPSSAGLALLDELLSDPMGGPDSNAYVFPDSTNLGKSSSVHSLPQLTSFTTGSIAEFHAQAQPTRQKALVNKQSSGQWSLGGLVRMDTSEFVL